MRLVVGAVGLVIGCGRVAFDEGVTGDHDAAGADQSTHTPVLVEDFESGGLAARWKPELVTGTVTVETSRPHRGGYSLHTHTDATTASVVVRAEITTNEIFPVLLSGMYVRTFVYAASPGAVSGLQVFIDVSQQQVGQQLGRNNTTLIHFFQYGSVPEVSQQSALAFALDQWVCLEWQMLAGESRVWIDDVEITDEHLTGLAQVAYDHFKIGSFFYQTSSAEPAHEVWIDDIVIDSQRIGCN